MSHFACSMKVTKVAKEDMSHERRAVKRRKCYNLVPLTTRHLRNAHLLHVVCTVAITIPLASQLFRCLSLGYP